MKREDRHSAAKRWVPVYVALMTGAFTSYLIMKGLKQIVHVESYQAYLLGILCSILTYFVVKKLLIKYE